MQVTFSWKWILEAGRGAARQATQGAMLCLAMGTAASAQTVGSGVLPGGPAASPASYDYFSSPPTGASPVARKCRIPLLCASR